METKGVHLWLLGLVVLGAGAGCLETVVGEAGVCVYDGKAYKGGEDFAASDGCNTCSCAGDGSVACTDRACDTDAPSMAPPSKDGAEAGTCLYDGKSYTVGATFRASDGCNGCTCQATGKVSCTLAMCPPDASVDASGGPTGATCMHGGKLYQAGESFPREDGCNRCTCSASGEVECTLVDCVPTCQHLGKSYKPGEALPASETEACICDMRGAIVCQKKCSYDGKSFASGTSFPALDGCNQCSCLEGAVSCTEKACSGASCTLNGRTYQPGETFYDAQRCNECSCTASGGVACTARVCDPSEFCYFGDSQFASGTSVPCPDGCNTCLCAQGNWASTDAACPALPRIEVCDATDGARIKASLLYHHNPAVALEVRQADCMMDGPNFKLCWDGTFKGDYPRQAELYAVSIMPPSCTSWSSRQAVFDLTPLQEAYKMAYQTPEGLVVLNVDGTTQNFAF